MTNSAAVSRDITQWFDESNSDHLKAFVHLRDQGFWPAGFIPEGMVFPSGWHAILVAKMADAYLKMTL